MNWLAINAFASTGWLKKDALGPGRDLLVDMQGAGDTFAGSLTRVGSAPGRIAELFLTHHHPDHLFIHDALALAEQGTPVHIGAQSWLDALESFERLHDPAATAAARALEKTGRLDLLPPAGCRTLRVGAEPPVEILWRPFPHGDGDRTCENLAFAFDDHVFSGDTSIAALFDPAHPAAAGAADLLGLVPVAQATAGSGRTAGPANAAATPLTTQTRPPRRVLCFDIAQLTRAAIAEDATLSDRRRRNYYDNHGILEEFLPMLAAPRLRPLFSRLRTLVPHHLRRQPLMETARTIRDSIAAAAKLQGFGFTVEIPGLPA